MTCVLSGCSCGTFCRRPHSAEVVGVVGTSTHDEHRTAWAGHLPPILQRCQQPLTSYDVSVSVSQPSNIRYHKNAYTS